MLFSNRQYALMGETEPFILPSGLGSSAVETRRWPQLVDRRTDEFAGFAPFVEGMETGLIDWRMSAVKGMQLVRVYEENRPGDVEVQAWIPRAASPRCRKSILGVAVGTALGVLRGGHRVHVGETCLATGRLPEPVDLIDHFIDSESRPCQIQTHHSVIVTSGHWTVDAYKKRLRDRVHHAPQIWLLHCVDAAELLDVRRISMEQHGRRRVLAESQGEVTQRHLRVLTSCAAAIAETQAVMVVFDDLNRLFRICGSSLGQWIQREVRQAP